MIKIICDKTGIEEEIPGSRIEVREGKTYGSWIWVIKGIETLANFSPDAYNGDIDMLLSKQSLSEWRQEDKRIKEEAADFRKAEITSLKTEMKTQKLTNMTTNTKPK